MLTLFLLFIACAFGVGWFLGQKRREQRAHEYLNRFSRHYFAGLNFLLNEQPDKAVDVFVKILAVDSETVETHLALGNLFRRRGEIDRAIRIHQNLIARPQLEASQRVDALLALGQDYLRAGVLDHAERLFLSALDIDPHHAASIHYLLDIYQQQRRWDQAIVIAKQFHPEDFSSQRTAIAHYHCECADRHRADKNLVAAEKAWQSAIQIDARSVRAFQGLAALLMSRSDWQQALKYYQQAIDADSEYISDMIPNIVHCYRSLHDTEGLKQYLEICLKKYPRAAVLLALIEEVAKQSPSEAEHVLATALQKHPSLRGLLNLIQRQEVAADEKSKTYLEVLHKITTALLKNKPFYRCTQCGLAGKVLYWQCPGCKNWGTSRPIHGIEGD